MHTVFKVVGFIGVVAGSAFLGALGLMLMEGWNPEAAHEAVDAVSDAWEPLRKGA